ncbi:MAG TPA: hypothetical protein VLL75_19815 [Vicinamibacteria bacterium]|nr:hypothetical protein [Vicinamibacteria bacterium]
MTISDLLQDEGVRRTLADHYRAGVAAAVRGFTEAAGDGEATTAALGRALLGQGELALADGRIVRWTTRYRRLRGRGGGAPEKNLGAEGLFEIEMEDEEKDRSRNTLPFQAWMGTPGYGEALVRGQAKRLAALPGGGVVIGYRPAGFVAVDAGVVAEGYATPGDEVDLADGLARDFVECRRGSTLYLFEPSLGGVLSVHKSFVTVRRWSPRHRVRTTLRVSA